MVGFVVVPVLLLPGGVAGDPRAGPSRRVDRGGWEEPLTTEQAAAREALSKLGRLVDDAFVAVGEEPAGRLEVWAPYDITDGKVHWPGPPITEVVGDEGCGVIEGPDAETIRAHLAGGDTITDEPGLVVLALLAPQEEACIVRQ